MRAGSLFTGLGGLDLAVHHALGAEPAWMCEYDPHCRAVLEQRFPGVPILPDVRELDHTVGQVDILHGGYPCQPFSVAGKRAGADDPRHLWPEFARLVRLLRPRLVIGENVAGHLRLGFADVLGDLAALGMHVRWMVVRASDVGAPHRRERLFFVATADAERERRHGRGGSDPEGTPGERGYGRSEPQGHRASATDADRPGSQGAQPDRTRDPREGEEPESARSLADDDGPAAADIAWGVYEPAVRQWERILGRPAPPPTDARGRLMPEFVEWMQGLPDGWTVGPARTHRLRMLGNAVVPQQAAHALQLLLEPRTSGVTLTTGERRSLA